MSSIQTTHVGSLPRSKELSEFLFAKDKGENINQNNFDNILKDNVEKVVKQQIDVGIDFVSDGEMSKFSYATYIKDRIDGFSGESERRAPADLDDFPEYKEKIAKSGGTPTYTRPCCTNELKLKDESSLINDLNNFKSSLKKNNHHKAFMNAASPGVINVFMPNKFYNSEEEYLDHIAQKIVCNDSARMYLAKDIYQSGMVLSEKYRKVSHAYRYALLGFVFLVFFFLSLFLF